MSDIRANTISDAAGTGPIALYKQSAAKASCAVKYVAASPVAGFSLNVSSLTDVLTGQVDLNYTSSFDNTEFAITMGADDDGWGNRACFVSGHNSVNSTRHVFIKGDTNAATDQRTHVIIHGDLA